ncbi:MULTISPECIES: hypothetical protein [Olivibacter]|uniref:Uncharacterized protein n=1 Tax=Olivibacter oleidegradans TaxID=760123 RepID=A0ABV6HR11_9SPHI|nr:MULTISPECIES: hypothetical protein [Olivibacter]QEL03901.1 hypothetical protein FKG96_24735 [Olivibacter sp. LS-1]
MKTIEINSKSNLENIVKNSVQNGVKPQDNVKPSLPQEKQQDKTIDTKKEASSIAEQKEPKAAETAPKLEKLALNLESTLKLVEELHRRKIQRDKLIDTIDTLNAFEVAQKDDAEETDSNHFQGCVLSIGDDKRREFITKNPYIIKKVAEYINTLCMDRLAEIEGEIQLPA